MGTGNTYFFGAGGGLDTFNFTGYGTSIGVATGFTIAVDSSFGATSSFGFSATTSLVTFGSGAGSDNIMIIGYATNGGTNINNLGFTFTTVATSVITALG
jgi:hypothetical protein